MSRRPQRPLSPDEILKITQKNVERIIYLKEQNRYSEWLLKGELHEKYDPVAAVAAFYAGELTSILFMAIKTDKTLEDYGSQIASLELPERVNQLEKNQYKFLVGDLGEGAFFQLARNISLNLRPSGSLVFSQPNNLQEESIYLISPTLAPPSPALRFIKRGAARQLKE